MYAKKNVIPSIHSTLMDEREYKDAPYRGGAYNKTRRIVYISMCSVHPPPTIISYPGWLYISTYNSIHIHILHIHMWQHIFESVVKHTRQRRACIASNVIMLKWVFYQNCKAFFFVAALQVRAPVNEYVERRAAVYTHISERSVFFFIPISCVRIICYVVEGARRGGYTFLKYDKYWIHADSIPGNI